MRSTRFSRGVSEIPASKQIFEFFAGQIAVAQNFRQQSRTDNFGTVDRHGRHSAVAMTQPMMASFDARIDETSPRERRDNLGTRQTGQTAHAGTVTR